MILGLTPYSIFIIIFMRENHKTQVFVTISVSKKNNVTIINGKHPMFKQNIETKFMHRCFLVQYLMCKTRWTNVHYNSYILFKEYQELDIFCVYLNG